MLNYSLRVRDLVHGTIQFTGKEQEVIEHKLFQRLRFVGQNDLTTTHAPSMNAKRYEHVLGTCHIAGRMAEQLVQSDNWGTYRRQLVDQYHLQKETIEIRFVEIVRLYALLHDIGHFPLSHLFEDALERHATYRLDTNAKALIRKWFRIREFEKPHEAFGAYLAPRLLAKLPQEIAMPLAQLLTKKRLPVRDPLNVIKKVVDGEIDADRIDFVRRDGLMAGGEYGNYDINRLCTSVMLVELPGKTWDIAFAEKAMTSLEALLFDRYRMYLWMHFHHRAVAVKTCAARLIERALNAGKIKKKHFTGTDENIAEKDDSWLAGILHKLPVQDEVDALLKEVVLYHSRENVGVVWKRRVRYRRLHEKFLEDFSRKRDIPLKECEELDFKVEDPLLYESLLTERIGMPTFYTLLEFKPVGKDPVRLYEENGKRLLRKKESLGNVSALVETLPALWKGDPQEFVVLLDKGIGKRLAESVDERDRIGDLWVNATTAYYLRQLRRI